MSFADDTKLLNLSKFSQKIGEDLQIIEKWCKDNYIKINTDKSFTVHFGKNSDPHTYYIDGKPIQNADSVRDLGVIIDKNLKFADHCNEIAKKCNRLCYAIHRFFTKRTYQQYFDLFKIYVRPIIEYNIVFWFPSFNKYEKNR